MIHPKDSAESYNHPGETERHASTLLSFPSKQSIASSYYEMACSDIANLASAISAFEPVHLFTRPEDVAKATAKLNQAAKKYPGKITDVHIIPFPTNHLWVRDTGPVYVYGLNEDGQRQLFAINFRFNEWGRGEKIGEHERAADGLDWPVMTTAQLQENASFARRVIEHELFIPRATLVESNICLEGGALALDGEGTLLATESSILNENRNPGLSRSQIEMELCRLLGVHKIIWFPGRKNLDVTDVHVDAEVNFIRPGVVALSCPHQSAPQAWHEVSEEIKEILSKSTDANGRSFEIHTINEPDPSIFGELAYDEPATNYVNFYFVNGALIVPQFGDERSDNEAVEIFKRLCPTHEVRPVHVAGLALAGGVIHCATQPVLSD